MDYKEKAKQWIEGNFDPETKRQVRELAEIDPAGLEEAFYKNLEFGTGGLRGIMGVGTNRMNRYTVGMATQGLANYIKAHAARGRKRAADALAAKKTAAKPAAGAPAACASPTTLVTTVGSLRAFPRRCFPTTVSRSISLRI